MIMRQLIKIIMMAAPLDMIGSSLEGLMRYRRTAAQIEQEEEQIVKSFPKQGRRQFVVESLCDMKAITDDKQTETIKDEHMSQAGAIRSGHIL